MRADKELAFSLRKQGKSYNEICRELRVAKSTLSNWFKGTDFSAAIHAELVRLSIRTSTIRMQALNKARGDTLSALYERAEVEAREELLSHAQDPLFIASVSAYWGEGDKNSKNQIRITNTDPRMLKMFVRFLTQICEVPVEKIRLAVFIYKDLDDETCRKFWSKNTGINSFHKTIVLPSRHKTRKLGHGVCTVVLTNSYLKRKLQVWIDQLPEIILNSVCR